MDKTEGTAKDGNQNAANVNGKELEIVWREDTLQIADAINGKWKDYIGNSPLRVRLWFGAKEKQFFRIRIGYD